MKNTVLSILRHILTFGGGFIIANNPEISPENIQGLAGAVVGLIGGIWGAYDEHRAEKSSKNSAFPFN